MSFLFLAMRSQMIPSAKNTVAIVRSAHESMRDCICPVGQVVIKKKYKNLIIPIAPRIKNSEAKLKNKRIGWYIA